MNVSRWLREILRCPKGLPSSATTPARPRGSGIPVLLVDEARETRPS